MWRSLRFLLRRTFQRRLCAGVALAAYLTVTFGFPLPARAAKDRSQPFPCQDHPCGCRTAEECWSHCCCFSPAERLAWARDHGVEPPPYAERPHDPPPEELTEPAATAEQADPGGWRTTPLREQAAAPSEPAPAPCCSQHSKRACCKDSHAAPAEKAAGRPAPSRSGWVIGAVALRCHGGSGTWLGTVVQSLPPPPLTWNPGTAATPWLTPGDVFVYPLVPVPPDPPPRATSA